MKCSLGSAATGTPKGAVLSCQNGHRMCLETSWHRSRPPLADPSIVWLPFPFLSASVSLERRCSMNLTKARAFAVACRPVGYIAHNSTFGNDQSLRTDMTEPDLSSGANIHSDAIANPNPAITPSRTSSAAVTWTLPVNVTGTLCICFPEVPCWAAEPLLVNDSLVRLSSAGDCGTPFAAKYVGAPTTQRRQWPIFRPIGVRSRKGV